MLVKFKSLDNWGVTNKKKFSRSRKFGALTMCKKCYTFYYKHSWHFYKPEQLEKDTDSIVSVHFTQCPACIEEELATDNLNLGSESSRLAELSQA
jgi:hypothetical protein